MCHTPCIRFGCCSLNNESGLYNIDSTVDNPLSLEGDFMYNYQINPVSGTLDMYNRGGSQKIRSFAFPALANKVVPTLDRSPVAGRMLRKFESWQSSSKSKSVLAVVGKAIKDLPKGMTLSGPNGESYTVGQGRGRPPAWVSRLLNGDS